MPAEPGPPAELRDLELMGVAPGEPGCAARLAALLSRRLDVTCRVRETPEGLELPELPGRNQVDADRLLELAESLAPLDGSVLVVLTGRDMGHPIFTHFFGRARRGGRAVVVSTARLDPRSQGFDADPDLMLRRAAREVLHELGHACGLGHCRRWDCVMRFASTVEALDNRGEGFCVHCAALLPESLAHART